MDKDKEPDWNALLKDHPIFSLPKSVAGIGGKGEASLQLSLSSLPDFKDVDPLHDGPTPSGRRQVMVIKDSELIVAAGSEIRITTLADTKFGRATPKSYKVLHTPNVQFEIHQMTLSPHGKLLAVAGAFQVAVIVLPRAGFTKAVPATIDCKSLQVGQIYHAADSSAPVAKIEWHPWGDGGTTLMVMTIDGKLREYDVSVDPEEPQQVLSFVPDKKKNSFLADEGTEREVASFAFGKGKADWGPLTVYAIMRSGDIYATCPYMPQNASIPSAYVHALECFVAAKQEYLTQSQGEGSSSRKMTHLYDFQYRYVTALLKQLPPGTVYPAISRPVPMHPPRSIKALPVRQGPFLLQPSPRTIDGSEGGDATDIAYMAFGSDVEEGVEGETERLGLVLASFQDGRVDVYLDVEKVEARWEQKERHDGDLPMLAVYETVDLGIISTLQKISASTSQRLVDLVEGNHPVLYPDPINQDTVYVYHAFGIHALQFESMLRSLALALRDDSSDKDGSSLDTSLQVCKGTEVHPIISTFDIESRSSSPIVGVSVPGDVYLTYSIFILTAAMRLTVFPLNLRSETPYSVSSEFPALKDKAPSPKLLPAPEQTQYDNLLGSEVYSIPAILANAQGLPAYARLSLPPNAKAEFMVTPDTLRYLGKVAEHITSQIRDVVLAHRVAETRAQLQLQELQRQRQRVKMMLDKVAQLKDSRRERTVKRVEELQASQKAIMARADAVLQSMVQKASPALSENESKWFEELRRMKAEVMGVGKYDDRALSSRLKLLQKEVDRLLPQLREMKEVDRRRQQLRGSEMLGVTQASELRKRSGEERNRIESMRKELVQLASRLDMTLEPPPNLKEPADT
ncbi:uncharacterized protein C8Q71DRAFT_826054 [Rhodofomes roseus]|uniref:Nucleoporin nup82 n=1 Tax=Rhodofomes roseus TaxID=34475 RepID=A0ABQ8KYU6_9APHY|nr:uncharacterized protein C8Q71DRAFT_826054 [Rhodofomes roseus]KAH9843921.1 hypothetical protein C8Q71DRAFT_826054 [Rhodofomes roseus]